MEGWKDEGMDGWREGVMKRWMDGLRDGWMGGGRDGGREIHGISVGISVDRLICVFCRFVVNVKTLDNI